MEEGGEGGQGMEHCLVLERGLREWSGQRVLRSRDGPGIGSVCRSLWECLPQFFGVSLAVFGIVCSSLRECHQKSLEVPAAVL